MPPKKGSNSAYYERLAEQASKGEYTLLDPLDYLVLEKLHEEGEMFAGLYPLGDSSQAVTKKFDLPKGAELSPHTVAVRLRALSVQGLAVFHTSIPGAGGSAIWQRTKKGKSMYKEWAERRSNGHGG